MPAGLQGVNKQREVAKKVEYRAQLGHGQIYGVDEGAIGEGALHLQKLPEMFFLLRELIQPYCGKYIKLDWKNT